MRFKKFLINWGPALILMGIIFFLSSRQRVVVSESFTVNFMFFKTLHIIEYAMLFFLVFRGFYKSLKKTRLDTLLWYTAIFTLAYAISDELHQTFIPTRNGSLTDIFIDAVGIFFAKYYTEIYFDKMKRFL